MESFYSLSYAAAETGDHRGLYGRGPQDLCLVATLVIAFTIFRSICIDAVFRPLAARLGLRKLRYQNRFAEQAYLALYYTTYAPWGVYLFAKATPTGAQSFEAVRMSLFAVFPDVWIDASTKLYYLSQFAFWLQQLLMIHVEERRKDHYQMLLHHIIACALIACSYPYSMIRGGTAILICMDSVDLIFSTAKILRYLDQRRACNIAFGFFVAAWILMRHGLYMVVAYSMCTETQHGTYSIISGKRISKDGGSNVLSEIFQPFVDPRRTNVAINANVIWFLASLLGILQCITIVWFVMICRVVLRVISGESAEDTRSDDEGDDDTAKKSASTATVSEGKDLSCEKRFQYEGVQNPKTSSSAALFAVPGCRT